MQVEELSLPQKQAEEEFNALKEAFKRNARLRKEAVNMDLYVALGHMSKHGKKVIEIWESFKKAGLNKDGDMLLLESRGWQRCFQHEKARQVE